MGFRSRVLSPVEIRDRLQSLSGNDRLDGSAIKNIPSGGGGLSSWQFVNSNYLAVAGDRLRVDASAGDVVITLPAVPSATDADIWIQRLDLTGNNVLLRSYPHKFAEQSSKDALFAPAQIDRTERISYVNPAIGYLGQHGLLTYQVYTPPIGGSDPLFSNVGLLLHFDSNFADSSSYNHTIAPLGNLAISTAQQKWGAGSANFPGNNAFAMPNHPVFDRGTGDFCWDGWFNADSNAFTTAERNILKAPNGANGLSIYTDGRFRWWVDGIGNLITGAPPVISENAWHYWAVIRSGSTTTIWLDDGVYATISSNNQSYDFRGWLCGRGGYNSDFKGYMDDLRFTAAARTITAMPTAAFPDG